MLICLVGPPQSGKNSLADYLVSQSFQRIHISPSPPPPAPLDAPPHSHLHFTASSDFLDHATRFWRRDFVTTDLVSKSKLAEFVKRPFVAVVAVDAPLGVRFRRAAEGSLAAGLPPPSLEQFVAADDLLFHGTLALPPAVTPENNALPLVASLSLSSASPTTTPPPAPTQLSSLTAAPASPTPSPARLTPEPSPELSRSPSNPSADPLTSVLPLAHLTLSNPYPTLSPFISSAHSSLLQQLSELLRPSWDTYFMLLASLASLRSNCMKRRVGAVLVRDKRVVSTGYNGTPRGVKNCGEGGCGRCNSHGDGLGRDEEEEKVRGEKGMSRVGEALDECLCLHAEENALLEAGRERVSGGKTEGAVLYCNTCPCLRCTVKIVQCGVKEVIYSLSYSMDTASRRVMEEAGVVLRQIPQPPFPR
ncbi:hypothetical protein JCM8547_000355 [Rhodosporidiobolus lusitaniae]